MSILSNFQLNAILTAALVAAAPTVGSLGYIGANIDDSTDGSFGFFHSNALLDTRGFTATGTGSTPATLDSNGLPTGACTLCINTSPGAGQNGPLPAGSYYLNVPSTGQTATAAAAGSYITLGTGVPQGDGVTIRYPLTIGTGDGSTISVNFSGALSGFPDLARDGSTSSVGQPTFCNTAVAFYSQYGSLRWMDWLLTNTRADTSWSSRPGAWLLKGYGQPHGWDKLVAFINAIAAYPGSKLKHVFINIPTNADSSYASGLSAYLNTLGLTSAVKVYPQRSNEHWNTSFTGNGIYQGAAMAELNCISNYGVTTPVITSIVTNGTTATFTTLNPVSTYFGGSTASCLVVAGAGGFSVGTYGAPTTATLTGANTFTVPTTAIWNSSTNGGLGGWVGIIFNLASTLIADGLLPDVFHAGFKWFTRLTYQDQQAWSVNRPQDRWFLDLKLYGIEAANGSPSAPIELSYAAYLGGGSASSWLYGAALGLYVQATSASTTLTQLFAQLNTLLGTTTDGQMRAHTYWCKVLGIHPLAYECGTDLQAVPTLNISASTDARMGTFAAAFLAAAFNSGMENLNWFTGTPSAFTNTSQGSWQALQSYADTSSPKYAALMAYGANPITYTNVYGSPGTTIDLTTFYQSGGAQSILNGLLGWFTAGNFVDVEIAIATAGSYTFTLNGCSQFANVMHLYLDPTFSTDGTSIGTSTLVATGGGWNIDNASAAVAVPDPVTVTLTAGIHILRFKPTGAVSTHGAALKSITVVQH